MDSRVKLVFAVPITGTLIPGWSIHGIKTVRFMVKLPEERQAHLSMIYRSSLPLINANTATTGPTTVPREAMNLLKHLRITHSIRLTTNGTPSRIVE